jgi:hypothetical protein
MFTAVTLSSGLFCYDDNLLNMLKSDKPAPSLVQEEIVYFLNTPSDKFWTSTFCGVYNVDMAGWGQYLYVDFSVDGFNIIHNNVLENTFWGIVTKYYVRCVSSTLHTDDYPHVAGFNISDNPQFTDNNNGTITDDTTSLVWLKCPITENGEADADGECASLPVIYTRAEAITACNNLIFADITDWRLPTVHELFSIRNMQRENPSSY